MLSGTNSSPHIIPLLSAFHYRDSYYFLFPWADGNLRQFWLRHPPFIDWKTSRLIIDRCYGIAKGLQRIQYAYGASDPLPPKRENKATEWVLHGNITPENFLYFGNDKDTGCHLVISGFSLLRHHFSLSEPRESNMSLKGFSPTYRPPEVDTAGDITPSYDI
ncbi:hypothetical protein GQ53DRAFT_7568 [Thozetella sp. PMI_491]|nr:hypothetical protein GQ53DRAFT_7568 [Thozetella sp. PMI_491]